MYKALPDFTDFFEITIPAQYHGVITGTRLNEPIAGSSGMRRITLTITTNGVNTYRKLWYNDFGQSTGRYFFSDNNENNWYEFLTSKYIKRGTGSPEGFISASIGSLYLRTDGGAGATLYVKESGTGNTGWAAK
jgi:hypothetical protein